MLACVVFFGYLILWMFGRLDETCSLLFMVKFHPTRPMELGLFQRLF